MEPEADEPVIPVDPALPALLDPELPELPDPELPALLEPELPELPVPEPLDPKFVPPEPAPLEPEPPVLEPLDPEPLDPEPLDPEPLDPEPLAPEPELEPLDAAPDCPVPPVFEPPLPEDESQAAIRIVATIGNETRREIMGGPYFLSCSRAGSGTRPSGGAARSLAFRTLPRTRAAPHTPPEPTTRSGARVACLAFAAKRSARLADCFAVEAGDFTRCCGSRVCSPRRGSRRLTGSRRLARDIAFSVDA